MWHSRTRRQRNAVERHLDYQNLVINLPILASKKFPMEYCLTIVSEFQFEHGINKNTRDADEHVVIAETDFWIAYACPEQLSVYVIQKNIRSEI